MFQGKAQYDRGVNVTHHVSRIARACCCLIGLTLWLAAACTAPASAPPTPSPIPIPRVRLYTRTPSPTVVSPTPTPTLSAQTLYQQGLTWREAWDLETALSHFETALAQTPDASVFASRAQVHRLAARYEAAAADIERALTLNPELAEAWREKAWLNRTEGAWEEARDAVNKLIELQPDDGTAYVLRAQIQAEGFDMIRMALADYNRAIALDPTLEKATLVARWRILAALGRWEQALRVSHQMFTSPNADPLRYYYRSWSFIQLGRLDDAIQMLFFGLGRYPDEQVTFYYALGVAYYERRAWTEAIQALEVALAQSGQESEQGAAWRQLGITTTDILGRMGVAYLKLKQCETGAAIVKRAANENPQRWDWAVWRIDACYVSLTPTPTPEALATP